MAVGGFVPDFLAAAAAVDQAGRAQEGEVVAYRFMMNPRPRGQGGHVGAAARLWRAVAFAFGRMRFNVLA